jgi:hypothetical protein
MIVYDALSASAGYVVLAGFVALVVWAIVAARRRRSGGAA